MAQESFQRYYEILDWCDEQFRVLSKEAAKERLLAQLQFTEGGWEEIAIRQHLARQFVVDGESEKGRQMLEALVEIQNNSEMSLANLASHYLYVEGNADKALEKFKEAEKASEKSGNFRRLVQAQLARVALELDDYVLLEKTLEKYLKIKVQTGHRDIKLEHDFFDRADKSRINGELAHRFKERFVAASKKAR